MKSFFSSSIIKPIILTLILSFGTTQVLPPACAQAVLTPQSVAGLPAAGTMLGLSEAYNPPLLKAVVIHPENPFRIDFILQKGESVDSSDAIKDESAKLIKYFLASLTIPEDDLWVNLSPYEKDRIIPDAFGLTEMGRDMLAQDYLLKQISASLIYPEDELGKKFWARVYEKASVLYGTTKIPVNTFNKVWIVPEKAVVYENGDKAFIVESHLTVMMEEDYLSLRESEKASRAGNAAMSRQDRAEVNNVSSAIMRDVILPELEKEVNEGKNFASLRQIYHSFILASWFKQKVKESLLAKVYVDQKKVSGVDIADKEAKQKIYDQYVAALKKGVFNYIKKEEDPATEQMIPRKYFSGGIKFATRVSSSAITVVKKAALPGNVDESQLLIVSSAVQISPGPGQNFSGKILPGSDERSLALASPVESRYKIGDSWFEPNRSNAMIVGVGQNEQGVVVYQVQETGPDGIQQKIYTEPELLAHLAKIQRPGMTRRQFFEYLRYGGTAVLALGIVSGLGWGVKTLINIGEDARKFTEYYQTIDIVRDYVYYVGVLTDVPPLEKPTDTYGYKGKNTVTIAYLQLGRLMGSFLRRNAPMGILELTAPGVDFSKEQEALKKHVDYLLAHPGELEPVVARLLDAGASMESLERLAASQSLFKPLADYILTELGPEVPLIKEFEQTVNNAVKEQWPLPLVYQAMVAWAEKSEAIQRKMPEYPGKPRLMAPEPMFSGKGLIEYLDEELPVEPVEGAPAIGQNEIDVAPLGLPKGIPNIILSLPGKKFPAIIITDDNQVIVDNSTDGDERPWPGLLPKRDAQRDIVDENVLRIFTMAVARYLTDNVLIRVFDVVDSGKREVVKNFIFDSAITERTGAEEGGRVESWGKMVYNFERLQDLWALVNVVTHEVVHKYERREWSQAEKGVPRVDITWLLATAMGDFNANYARGKLDEALAENLSTRSVSPDLILNRPESPMATHGRLRDLPDEMQGWSEVKAFIEANKSRNIEKGEPEPVHSYVEGSRLSVYAGHYYGEAGYFLIKTYARRHADLNFAQIELATAVLRNILARQEIAAAQLPADVLEGIILERVIAEGEKVRDQISYADLVQIEQEVTAGVVSDLLGWTQQETRKADGKSSSPARQREGEATVNHTQNGGIALTSDAMNLEIKNTDGPIKFVLNPEQIKQLQIAPGFFPYIVDIKPLPTTLNMFWGGFLR